jgi:hypothetical protein
MAKRIEEMDNARQQSVYRRRDEDTQRKHQE